MIEDLLECIQKEINKRLPEDRCTDDWQWNNTCFQFVIISGEPPKEKISDPYRFCFDAEDVFERTVIEQVWDWIDRWF